MSKEPRKDESGPSTDAHTEDAAFGKVHWKRPLSDSALSDSAPSASRSYARQKSGWLVRVLGLLALLVAVGVGAYSYLGEKKEFPLLEPGSYVGTIEGLYADSVQTNFYLERAADREELFVALLRPGWKPQLVSTWLRAPGESEARWILPLLISRGDERLRFVGKRRSDGQYAGTVEELETGREAPWSIAPVQASLQDVAGEAAQVRLWLMLVTELEEVEAKIKAFEQRVPEQRAEIERLTTLLTEGEALRSRANEKFDAVRDDLLKVGSEYERAKAETQKLEGSLEVSLKVTALGKLVSLSRESLEREWRIVDSLLRTEVPLSEASLQEEYEHAELVKKIQDELLAERAKIEELEAKAKVALRSEKSLRARYNPVTSRRANE